MKHFILLSTLLLLLTCCGQEPEDIRYGYPDIIDIHLTPDPDIRLTHTGCFTDEGSWMGFTLPEKDRWINGFCGPFSLDARKWFAASAVEIRCPEGEGKPVRQESVYYPGLAEILSETSAGRVHQRLFFADDRTAILEVEHSGQALTLTGRDWHKEAVLAVQGSTLTARNQGRRSSGITETLTLTFPEGITPVLTDGNYTAEIPADLKKFHILLSFSWDGSRPELPADCTAALRSSSRRWNGYLGSVLRRDMKPEYSRIAVKTVVTLLSNWRKERGDLLHEGLVPSHAMNYFVGYWAWDSWRFAAALAQFAPEVAKNNIRAMFDYQQPDGMIIDCLFTNAKGNNARDSKPPIASWAVNEILIHDGDTAFVREMYPKLLSYYKWWYEKRDHDRNGICEFGSTDGTLEAAAWESGMDNAIRFDHTEMLQNGPDAWSMDQENVDLNSFLALEARLLKKFAALLGETFDAPDFSEKIAGYFFDEETGYFYDRKLSDRSFISEPACEGYLPFWTSIATEAQMEKALKLFTDEKKFSTYIPFPTAAADNPSCSENGYWRGPIWLDQTYFAIRGLRNYGYRELADRYTRQVFDRLQGLKEQAPIYENYGTRDGRPLQASHFSWSAAHLLMMYLDYGTAGQRIE